MNIYKNLKNLINSLLETGVVPDVLKTWEIVPTRKIANKNKSAVSNNNNKINENAVYLQFTKFLNGNNVISEFQSGFRERHRCEKTIYFIFNEWRVT